MASLGRVFSTSLRRSGTFPASALSSSAFQTLPLSRSLLQPQPHISTPFPFTGTSALGPQRTIRTFMVNTEETPNPDSLKFMPNGQQVLPQGTMDFPDLQAAKVSPLATLLLKQEGVKRVFLAETYISITKQEDFEWDMIRTIIFGTLSEFYASGNPVLLSDSDIPNDTAILDSDSEEVAMIKELLDTRIRPAVQDDGGDITYLGFVDGVVFLLMQGSCSGCPSSSVTLKNGIERMLMHWVPQVQGVMAVESREEFDAIVEAAGGSVDAASADDLVTRAQNQSKLLSASEQALNVLEDKIREKKAADALAASTTQKK
eukprot:TRINITY_DN3316_c0_g1_i1.p2 TRINITY_DN3316_c0_g1~~TRINITY_DN3316_c0_g1_i1.p2  ORF type:complete len:317 (-),score=49.80 TRINITY_DN3316_c0_g1_i1:1529-2479(-)